MIKVVLSMRVAAHYLLGISPPLFANMVFIQQVIGILEAQFIIYKWHLFDLNV